MYACTSVGIYLWTYIRMYACMIVYIQRGYAPFRRAWAVGFGTWEGAFWSHVGVFWAPIWRLWSLFGVYVGYCRAQMGVCEVQRPQGRGLEGLGLAQGRFGTRILDQHGPNLSQVGTNLGPAWAHLEPTWSQLGSILGPDRLK